MANVIPTSFKTELLSGTHNFASGGNSFKLALYTSSASLGAGTTAYTSSNEVSGTGYSATGSALTAVAPTSSGSSALAAADQLEGGSGCIKASRSPNLAMLTCALARFSARSRLFGFSCSAMPSRHP